MKTAVLFASTFIAFTACAGALNAQTSADSSAAPATTTAAADPHEMICEYEAQETGTLLGRVKVCKTRRQWAETEKQTQVGQDLHDSMKASQFYQPGGR